MENAFRWVREIIQPKEHIASQYLQELGLTWQELIGKKVLDLGAGSGEFAKAARKRGVIVASLDKQPEFWREKIRRFIGGNTYVKGDAYRLPFQNGSFDMVVCRRSIHWMVDNQQQLGELWKEVKRTLKEKGEFCFNIDFLNASELMVIFNTNESILKNFDKDVPLPERVDRQRTIREISKRLEEKDYNYKIGDYFDKRQYGQGDGGIFIDLIK
jgi:ubiquinone/menaquinone biosynthesis C-methylase UbiE